MPIYEYRCAACGHELEVLQKFSEAPLAVCPACGKSELTKLVSAGGFQLKGTGWYVTDFKGSGKPAGKAKEGDGGAADTSKTNAASDSKADTTTSKESKTDSTKESKSESKSESKAA